MATEDLGRLRTDDIAISPRFTRPGFISPPSLRADFDQHASISPVPDSNYAYHLAKGRKAAAETDYEGAAKYNINKITGDIASSIRRPTGEYFTPRYASTVVDDIIGLFGRPLGLFKQSDVGRGFEKVGSDIGPVHTLLILGVAATLAFFVLKDT